MRQSTIQMMLRLMTNKSSEALKSYQIWVVDDHMGISDAETDGKSEL